MNKTSYPIYVITVVRNDVNHIKETIESVVHQNYQDLHYIIQDGASTDGTLEIAKEYESKYPNIHVFSEPDKGVYFGMNNALGHISGETGFVNFMNSGDTFYSTDVVGKMVKSMESASSILYGDVMICYWNGQYLERPNEWWRNWKVWFGMGICHQTMFFPLLQKKNLYYDTSFRICADYDLAYRLRKMGVAFTYVPLTVCKYTWGNGISSNPSGLIPVYKEIAKVRKLQCHPLIWVKILLEYYRHLKK